MDCGAAVCLSHSGICWSRTAEEWNQLVLRVAKRLFESGTACRLVFLWPPTLSARTFVNKQVMTKMVMNLKHSDWLESACGGVVSQSNKVLATRCQHVTIVPPRGLPVCKALGQIMSPLISLSSSQSLDWARKRGKEWEAKRTDG